MSREDIRMSKAAPDGTRIASPDAWLAELFQYEVCAECGWGADKHRVGPDPLGLPHAYCLDPVPEDLSDDEIQAEMTRRTDISTRA
jgi:hypothetical protein